MKVMFAMLLLSGSMTAAVIRGTVVEKQTGKPLARALVVVQPVRGSAGSTVSQRTDTHGQFLFSDMVAGTYLVAAGKTGFAQAEYGQKRWHSAGMPLVVKAEGEIYMKLALPHFGAITGRVVDENDVGIAESTLIFFANARPPEVVSQQVKTDDRGQYRRSELGPGQYLVRSSAQRNDEYVYLPTFAPNATRIEDAQTVDVTLDRDSVDVNIRAATGTLVPFRGRVVNGRNATLTLVSDIGSEDQHTDQYGNFEFQPVAPGRYELYAWGQDGNSRGLMAFAPVEVMGLGVSVEVELAPMQDVQFVFEDTAGKRVDPGSLQLLGRRKALLADGRTEYLHPDGGNLVRMAPGRWEIGLGPNPSWYLPTAWSETLIAPSNRQSVIKLVLSPSPAALRGVVMDGGQPVAGVPVHLEAYDAAGRRRERDLRTVRTDIDGYYTFAGLAPGTYRILATFDYQAPDVATMTGSGARSLTLEEGKSVDLVLELFAIQ